MASPPSGRINESISKLISIQLGQSHGLYERLREINLCFLSDIVTQTGHKTTNQDMFWNAHNIISQLLKLVLVLDQRPELCELAQLTKVIFILSEHETPKHKDSHRKNATYQRALILQRSKALHRSAEVGSLSHQLVESVESPMAPIYVHAAPFYPLASVSPLLTPSSKW